ncbi:KdsC family phosphatase [Flavobacterium capsici]|uniref:HAD hydrolase family protein n=1 Tax=Flavobacterium capsici TaxID=3075618 RepID=A0AA96EXX1_9FLAO|nr:MULTISPECIES: HAD hydrolase family protein [unclassified Flavobacterium]WNM20226.1 HAD hydrolase family protein [Flavobacterium sp. PMR2A8]WNM21616.1 HAD hydrolase family protein [Flavobacterium sp. PMTSA4]
MKLPKLIITDIDGVWTDGGMYYDQHGNELKKFNTYDSAGVLYAKILKIPVVIITGEDTQIVKKRADKLKIEHLFQGVKDKVAIVQKLTTDLQISFEDCAFIGDDINDVKLLELVGFSAAPKNAAVYIKKRVHYITKLKGGKGAFRDFVEHILAENNMLEIVINEAVKGFEKPV